MQEPNLSQVSLCFFNVVPYGVQLSLECNLASTIQRGFKAIMQHKRQRHFAFVLRRWLTWFYPQVCQNQALSGASIYRFALFMSAPGSGLLNNHPPEYL